MNCNKCKQDKSESDFYRMKDGRIRKPCKDCIRGISKVKEGFYDSKKYILFYPEPLRKEIL